MKIIARCTENRDKVVGLDECGNVTRNHVTRNHVCCKNPPAGKSGGYYVLTQGLIGYRQVSKIYFLSFLK